MRYDLHLRIEYEYDAPTLPGRQLLHVLPADLPGRQRRLACRLDIDPEPEERSTFRDFWGNEVVDVAFRRSHENLVYRLEAVVECGNGADSLDLSPSLSALASRLEAWRSLDAESPHHFLAASRRVPLGGEPAEFVREVVAAEMTVRQAVMAVGEAVHGAMRFDPDATHVDTTVAEAFASRRGVCQDYSHILISCLRSIGIPAGYVSGYLRTNPPPGRPRLAGADAMHAWVRAWCGPEAGWMEYDPTNAAVISADHVVIAGGRDYTDVAPVRGILRTAGRQVGRHAVDVVPVPDAAPEPLFAPA